MSDKILQFYFLIMAIPIARMIEVVSKNPEYNYILRFAILLIVVIEWIYSQSSFTDEHEYTPAKLNLYKSISTIFSEIGICISIAIAAFQIEYEKYFYTFMISFFLLDLITQLLTRPSKVNKLMRKVTSIWICLDMIEICVFITAIILAYFNLLQENCRATVLILIVAFMTIWDFTHNKDFYFDNK